MSGLNLLFLGFPRCRNRHFNSFFCTSQPSSERCHRAVLISLVEFQIPLVHSSALTRRFQDSRFHLSALVRRFKGLQKCSKMIPYLGYLRSICLISVVKLIYFFYWVLLVPGFDCILILPRINKTFSSYFLFVRNPLREDT